MKPITVTVQPVFVRTRNVRNFEVMMDALDLSRGEGRLGMIFGQAGRGKTRTAQWYAAHNRCVYMRMMSIWKHSETAFLQVLLRELGERIPPARKSACFAEAIDRIISDPRPIFIDEPEKMPRAYLELFRDLADAGACPIILIGEEELPGYMSRDRRIWTRTFYQLEFEAIQASDVIMYAKESAGLTLSGEVAAILCKTADGHRVTDGNFRVIKRTVYILSQICNAKQTVEVTTEMAKIAVKTGL
jgi:DNA transposition AAA+ family ATPase